MKIGIVGKGVVGTAVYIGFKAIGHNVCYHDTKDQTTITDVIDTDIVFVCVPTKQNQDGSCDTSIINSVVNELDLNDYQGIIALKSTAIPGTTQSMIDRYPKRRICFVPEFLKEKSAEVDFMDNMDVLIVGTHDKEIYNTIIECHKHLPKNVAHQLTPTEAEVAKYFCNVYNALRITFASGMYNICKKLGADYQKVFGACIKRDNIKPEYLKAGPDYLGFGGACLPKDSRALDHLIVQLGLDLDLFKTIVTDNEKHIKGK